MFYIVYSHINLELGMLRVIHKRIEHGQEVCKGTGIVVQWVKLPVSQVRGRFEPDYLLGIQVLANVPES